MQLPFQEVGEILGSGAVRRSAVCERYSTDSRRVEPGDLFFAIPGPRFDGHDFVPAALEKGAVGAVVREGCLGGYPASLRPSLLGVPDTTRALQELGQAVRRKWSGPLVAVTGSAGKTTTKEMIASVLGVRLSVLKSPENLNNELGVPLSLLALENSHQVAVMELAMSHPGEIRRLASVVEPNVGVVTNVAPVHLEFFESLAAIARAKYELVEQLPSDGVLVLNADDEHVRQFRERGSGRVVTFGVESRADYQATRLRVTSAGGMDFDLRAEGRVLPVSLHLPGAHNVRNALAAVAVARQFDVPLDSIVPALDQLRSYGQRSEVFRLPGGVTLINDSYNSNPQALEEMLRVLGTWPSAGRRLLVAGEMLELGETAPQWHCKLGEKAVAMGRVDWLVAVQNQARFFLEGARQAGLKSSRMRFFARVEEAGEFVSSLISAGDTVLVKGSRGVGLERLVERVRSHAESSSAAP